MRPSVVKAKLRRNEPVLITCLHLTDPSMFELAGLMGFDGIWMDLEHHGYSVERAADLMRASRVGCTDIMVRPAKGEFMRMGRLLEAGAHGVMYPRCESADEAREVVKWAKFAPLGRRGFDGANADQPYCTMDMEPYVRMANEQTWIVIQIEDPDALEHVDEIASLPGVDVLLLGQADFTTIAGIPGQFNHPMVHDALKRLAAAARKHGKNWGTPVGTPERARQLMDMGARFLAHGADVLYVKTGMEQVQSNFAKLGFTFHNQLTGDGGSYVQK